MASTLMCSRIHSGSILILPPRSRIVLVETGSCQRSVLPKTPPFSHLCLLAFPCNLGSLCYNVLLSHTIPQAVLTQTSLYQSSGLCKTSAARIHRFHYLYSPCCGHSDLHSENLQLGCRCVTSLKTEVSSDDKKSLLHDMDTTLSQN